MSSVEKPLFPSNCSSWWKKRMEDLTEEQRQLKREYYRQYNLWKRAKQEVSSDDSDSPPPEKNLKESRKKNIKENIIIQKEKITNTITIKRDMLKIQNMLKDVKIIVRK